MKRILFYLCFTCFFYQVFSQSHNLPWKNGALQISSNSRYLQHTNGSPFFWLGDVYKRQGTFVVHVSHCDNATWQGEVTWAEANKKKSFRSALELIRLIDGALEVDE